jgi:hypothetical protein
VAGRGEVGRDCYADRLCLGRLQGETAILSLAFLDGENRATAGANQALRDRGMLRRAPAVRPEDDQVHGASLRQAEKHRADGPAGHTALFLDSFRHTRQRFLQAAVRLLVLLTFGPVRLLPFP